MFTLNLLCLHAVMFKITLPSILSVLFTYASSPQCDIFSQLLPNWIYNNVYSISATYTYSTVYNYSPQYTYFAVYMCFHFHNVNIYPHITVILSIYNVTLNLRRYIQYYLKLISPVTYFAVDICFHFHNVNIYPHITVQLSIYNVYIESSPLHTILFTINFPSFLSVLFTYAFLFTMWI